MGLLTLGYPLEWDETKKYASKVQELGVAQFINNYTKSKDRADGPFKWGDEVEYVLVKLDDTNRIARLSLRADEVFQKISENKPKGIPKSFWNPEYGEFMVEGTPGKPYGCDGNVFAGLCEVEESMRFRRDEVTRALAPNEVVMSITNFPRLGQPDSTYPDSKPDPENSLSGSQFVSDAVIYKGHPRFKTIMRNVRIRRGRKVCMNVPIFRDINTPNPFIEQFSDEESNNAALPNHIYMDTTVFGMGCCCLQVTYQATHIEEAKVLYDQLVPIAPIALALSAAAPIFRGYLSEVDCRWDVIAGSVDDRTPEELGEMAQGKDSSYRIPKSRYDSVSSYLSRHGQRYNDIPLVINQTHYNTMVENNVEPAIARHIAHLFIRDPIVVYKEKLNQSIDEVDHFENIQSSNWQTVRFKPPPYAGSPIGWRVEFRPIEAQTTDFENAAYVVFITLLTRVILAYKLNFLIPISMVDENMKRAQKRDSIRNSKFWFRKDILHKSNSKGPLITVLENCNSCESYNLSRPSVTLANQTGGASRANQELNQGSKCKPDDCAAEMTINQIINGCEGFVGIMPIICHYVESFRDGSNSEQIDKLHSYLRLIANRASLKSRTTARMIRDYITSHPSYNHDSVVNQEVNYDLLTTLNKISQGEIICPDFTGGLISNSQQVPKQQHHATQYEEARCCFNNNGTDNTKGITVKKSSTLCNGFNLNSKKSPSGRATRKGLDKPQDHNSSRSMSR